MWPGLQRRAYQAGERLWAKTWAGVGGGGKRMEKHGPLETASSSAYLEYLPKEDVMERQEMR